MPAKRKKHSDWKIKNVYDLQVGDVLCIPGKNETMLVLTPEFPEPYEDFKPHMKEGMFDIHPAFIAVRQTLGEKPFWFLFCFSAHNSLRFYSFLRGCTNETMDRNRMWFSGRPSSVGEMTIFPCWFEAHDRIEFCVLE